MATDALGYIRGEDNFVDPYDYILNQLFIYSYADLESDDVKRIRQKLWILDGSLTNEEETEVAAQLEVEQVVGVTEDNDYDNPLNHWGWLMNELVFLDRYIRTEEDELDEANYESDFNKLKYERVLGERALLNTENPDTGNTYERYEIPYNTRATYLTDTQFADLYAAWVVKRDAGELETAFDIVQKVVNANINEELVIQELKIEKFVQPADLMVNILEQAEDRKEKNDRTLVDEMNEIRKEVLMLAGWTYDKKLMDKFKANAYYIQDEYIMDSAGVVMYQVTSDGLGSSVTAYDEVVLFWETETAYTAGTILKEEETVFNYYRCKEDHTSTDTVFADDITYWEPLPIPALYDYKWRSGSIYAAGDEIGHGGLLFSCLVGHTAGVHKDDLEAGYWEEIPNPADVPIVMINFPQPRLQVELVAGSATHKDAIAGGGGYRFIWVDMKGEVQDTLATFVDIFGDPADPADLGWYDNENENGEQSWFFEQIGIFPDEGDEHIQWSVEWTIADWEVCVYKEGGDTADPGGIISVSTAADLDSGTAEQGDLTTERHEVLVERWDNLNTLREDEIQQTGTRIVIESMVNANIPDLSPDLFAQLQNKKDEKVNLTGILKENCPEFT